MASSGRLEGRTRAGLKAILIDEARPLHPFRATLADLKLTGESLVVRLRRQLGQCGFSVIEVRRQDTLKLRDFPALICWPGAVVSDAALESISGAIAREAPCRPFQAAFGDRDHEVLSWPGRPSTVRPLRLRWCAAPEDAAAPIAVRDFARPADLELSVGVAESVYGVARAAVGFTAIYGRQVETWADLHTLASLRAREYTACRIRPFKRWVPPAWLDSAANAPSILRRMNRIGRNCRIHPSAILEGCVVGDGVEIGPYCYLRASWIGAGVTLRELSSVKASVIEEGAYLMRCDVFNSVIGASCLIVTDMIYNCWIGAGTFIGGGSGFSDFNATRGSIEMQLPEGKVDSGMKLLGSAVGEDCFIGAGLLFRPGLAIPAGTRILNSNMIERAPTDPGGVHVAKGNRLLQIPGQFLAKGSGT